MTSAKKKQKLRIPSQQHRICRRGQNPQVLIAFLHFTPPIFITLILSSNQASYAWQLTLVLIFDILDLVRSTVHDACCTQGVDDLYKYSKTFFLIP
ncbi:hypothetical protein PFAS1_11105 [Pseudomonas frederiksbergensis]|nr:hypothetical protein PFAS1_11105 [Pseudomonas frederiksbergensis]